MTLSLTRRQRKALGKLGAILINLPFVFLIMIPLLYTFMMSVMPADELYSRFWPSHADFSSYLSVFTKTMIPRHILNSFIVAGSVTILQMITCSMAAFSFSFLEFRGRNFVFMCILATMMVPWEATIIANYLTVSTWGWLDSYRVLILPYGCSAMGVFLMRQFMMTIPDSMLEAARVDGASEYLIFWKIVMPMVKPAWMTLAIFTFKDLWNTGETQYIYEESMKTLTAVMQSISSAGIARAGAGAAVALLMMIPPVVVFVISQSSVMETMATTGIKG